MNNYVSCVNIHVKYVDDLTVAEIVDVAEDITYTVPDILDSICRMCQSQNVSKPLKCEELRVCPSKRHTMFPDLTLNNSSLLIVISFNFLRVYINS